MGKPRHVSNQRDATLAARALHANRIEQQAEHKGLTLPSDIPSRRVILIRPELDSIALEVAPVSLGGIDVDKARDSLLIVASEVAVILGQGGVVDSRSGLVELPRGVVGTGRREWKRIS
jgi:hypothetical protein